MPTIRQNKVINATKQALGENSRNINKGKILKQAGYPYNTSNKPSQVYNSQAVKEGLKPVLNQLIRERQRAIDRMKDTIDKATYRDIQDATDKLTKNIQLLQGKSTDNIKIDIDDKQYSAILKREQDRMAKD